MPKTDNAMNVLDEIIAKGETENNDARFLRHVKEMTELPRFLSEDLAESAELHNFTTHEFAVRTFVRTMAAEFEATLHLLQQLLLLMAENNRINLLPEEISLLRGETYSLGKAGRVTASPKFLPFAEALVFTLNVVSRVFKAEVFCDTSDPRWNDVKTYIRIRNRLMHPKKVADLDVTDKEIDSLNRAQDWVRTAFKSIFSSGEEHTTHEQRP